MKQKPFKLFLVLAGLAISAATVSAQIIIAGNISSGVTINPDTYDIGNSDSKTAVQFTAGADASLGRIDLFLKKRGGGLDPEKVLVGVLSNGTNTFGDAPFTILESTEISISSLTGSIVSATFSGLTDLFSGTKYWLALGVPNSGALEYSGWGSIGGLTATTNTYQGFGLESGFPGDPPWPTPSFTNQPAPSFNIYAVPEPSTYALIIGTACLGFVIWKRRQQSKELVD